MFGVKKIIPNFLLKKDTDSSKNSQGSTSAQSNKESKSKDQMSKEIEQAKKERMQRNLSSSVRNLALSHIVTEQESDEFKIVHTISKPFDGPGGKKTALKAQDIVQDRADSKNFEDLDDLYGARTLVKKKVVKE